MSLHPDTLITVPNGLTSLKNLKPSDFLYNLSTEEYLSVSEIVEDESDVIAIIRVVGLPPLVCSPSQKIVTTDGFIAASDLCIKCNILTGFGVNRIHILEFKPLKSKLYTIYVTSESTVFLANGIYVVAERRN